MTAHNALTYEPATRMSREGYRAWAEQQPSGRYERINGVVVAMAPERPGYNNQKALAWLTLRRAVQAAGLPCHVYADRATVEIGDSDYEPDAVVHYGAKLPDRLGRQAADRPSSPRRQWHDRDADRHDRRDQARPAGSHDPR